MVARITESDERVAATQRSVEDSNRNSIANLQIRHDQDRVSELEQTVLQLVSDI